MEKKLEGKKEKEDKGNRKKKEEIKQKSKEERRREDEARYRKEMELVGITIPKEWRWFVQENEKEKIMVSKMSKFRR